MSSTTQSKASVQIFYSYSHKDEALRDELEEALALLKRQGHISGWHDRQIAAGQQWADQINESLESARVILLLVSSSFLASDYCYGQELGRALERHEAGEAVVIPIIVRPCDWHGAPFARLQSLPKDAKPVTSWANKDEAWTDVARGIRRAVEAMTAKPRLDKVEAKAGKSPKEWANGETFKIKEAVLELPRLVRAPAVVASFVYLATLAMIALQNNMAVSLRFWNWQIVLPMSIMMIFALMLGAVGRGLVAASFRRRAPVA
jgi:uncharacterized integral membrane protein